MCTVYDVTRAGCTYLIYMYLRARVFRRRGRGVGGGGVYTQRKISNKREKRARRPFS